jgi:hypothetical protein
MKQQASKGWCATVKIRNWCTEYHQIIIAMATISYADIHMKEEGHHIN